MDMIEQFGRVMFAVSSDQGGLIRSRVKDLLTEFQQFRSSLSHGSCCRGQCKTEWLGTVQVQAEETLRHFERLFLGAETMTARLALRATFNAMRISAEQSALDMAAGAADFTERHLQGLRLGHGVAAEHFMNGMIGGDKRQAVRDFKAV